MNKVLNKLLPENKKDFFTYYLLLIAILPFIYIYMQQKYTYMLYNAVLFFGFMFIIFIELFIKNKFRKQLRNLFRSPAFCILSFMFLWIFISAFFAFNKEAAWMGTYQGYHAEESVWQYMFYFSIALCVILMKKENIKYVLSFFMVAATFIIFKQIILLHFGHMFIHKNHTGYYLCVTLMISMGMFFYSKNFISAVLSFWVMLLHFVNLILNGSMGPIIGIIAFFVIGFIYFLIHKRKLIIKFVSCMLCFVAVVGIFDYVPKLKDFRDEPATTVEKVVGIGYVALNKLGIISEKELEDASIAPGSNGYARLDMWKRAYENMLEFPIFGLGSGSWKSYNEDMPNIKPHNEFLQYGVTGGFPALIAYVSLLVYLFIKFRRGHKQMSNLAFLAFGAMVVYLVQSVFGNIMPFTAPVFYIVLGIAIREIDGAKFELEEDKNSELVENNSQVEDDELKNS